MTKNNINRIWLLPILLALLSVPLQSTAQDVERYDGEFWNGEMAKIAKASSQWGWVDFQDGSEIDPQNIFVEYKNAFNLGIHDNMVINRVENDDLGFTHYRYDQYYKGVKVIAGEFIVHVDPDGFTYVANGKLITGLNLDVIPKIKEEIALQVAMENSDSDGFLWLNPQDEEMLKYTSDNPEATYYPKGELVIQKILWNNDFRPANYKLAWKFDIYLGGSGESRSIFIDAVTGNYLNYHALSKICSGASGTSTWDGNQTLSVQANSGSYRLHDDCTGSHSYELRTFDLQRSNSSAIDYFDGDLNWTTGNTATANLTGVQCHWAAHETRDYFQSIHGRSSWDGGSANWISYNEATISGSHNNACFDCWSNIAAFGGGTNSISPADDWNTLDLAGHEYAHGVTRTSANLVYSNESGALNESFSDIFGEMTELYSRGSRDWLICGDFGAIRNMANPNAFGDPDTYWGTNWCNFLGTCTGDNGGVHTNSGVQNFWFTLLVAGGSGSNDFGTPYSVSGIGDVKARAIAYRNLTVYLTSGSNHVDARKGALQSARNLYGACSNEEIQTGSAWHACGVGPSLSIYNWNLCGAFVSGFHQGINSVIAANGCATTASATAANVTFTAANEVRLLDGFVATASGANAFVAYLEPCSYTRWKVLDENPENVSDVFEEEYISVTEEDGNFNIYPNPFNSKATVSFKLTEDDEVTLVLYDINGSEIERIYDNVVMKKGSQTYELNGEGLAAGLYFVTLTTKEKVTSKRIVLQ